MQYAVIIFIFIKLLSNEVFDLKLIIIDIISCWVVGVIYCIIIYYCIDYVFTCITCVDCHPHLST